MPSFPHRHHHKQRYHAPNHDIFTLRFRTLIARRQNVFCQTPKEEKEGKRHHNWHGGTNYSTNSTNNSLNCVVVSAVENQQDINIKISYELLINNHFGVGMSLSTSLEVGAWRLGSMLKVFVINSTNPTPTPSQTAQSHPNTLCHAPLACLTLRQPNKYILPNPKQNPV